MRKTPFAFPFGVVLLALTGGVACSNRGTTGKPVPVPPDGVAKSHGLQTGQHWVQDAKVRAVMKQIAAATGSWPQDLPPHAEAANPLDLERAFDDAGVLANILAKAASEIPAAVAERQMPDEHRLEFVNQAEMLHDRALELKEAARLHKVAEMQRALGRINTTCFECHSHYRDVAGELSSTSRD